MKKTTMAFSAITAIIFATSSSFLIADEDYLNDSASAITKENPYHAEFNQNSFKENDKKSHFESILKKHFKDVSVYAVKHDEVSNMFIIKTNVSIIYSNLDGTRAFILTGRKNYPEMLNLRSELPKDLTDDLFVDFNKEVAETLKTSLVYKSKDEKHVVKVLTDPACGYCQKLHSQLAEYQELGITIEYYPFPAFGREMSHDAMARVFSLPEDKQKEAMNQVKKLTAQRRGQELDFESISLKPATQAASDYVSFVSSAGSKLGFTGTPGLILPNGKTINGYLSPENMLKALNTK